MSILNGNVNDDAIFTIDMPFGKQMEEITLIPVSSATVATLGENSLICGGKDVILLYSVDVNGKVNKISELKISGTARQIGVYNDFVYVSARESGVSVCDFSNPQKPILAYQIDSLELATGIAVSNGVLAITNRHMGCELYDVRNPYMPKRLGDFYCGEAQSVCLYKNLAVVSHWIGKEVGIFDISNPAAVKKLSSFSVDGYADGVCIVEHNERLICIAGTGHHSSRLENRKKYSKFTFVTAEMIAEGYGSGHGVEIFDITNPLEPEWLSTLKTPPHFGGPDTWLVYSDGKNCVFTDSMNGIFLISLEDVRVPEFTGYYRLKPLENQRLSPPSIQVQSASVTGAASVGGFLCAASGDDGVYILKPNQPINPFVKFDATINFNSPKIINSEFYCSLGQIHNFVEHNGRIYLASGRCGIEVIDISGNLIYEKETVGICHDICLHQGRLYTAEGDMGVASYDITETLTECSRVTNIGCARQVVTANADLIVQLDCVKIVKLITNDGKLELADGEVIDFMLYHRHLARTMAGKYTVAMPTRLGPIVLETDNKIDVVESLGRSSCAFDDGACGFNDKLILIYGGKYLCLDNPLDISKPFKGNSVKGALLSGTPYVLGDRLILLNRCTGIIELFDISDVYNPKFIKRINTGGHPEACGLINGEIFVALGFDGILKI